MRKPWAVVPVLGLLLLTGCGDPSSPAAAPPAPAREETGRPPATTQQRPAASPEATRPPRPSPTPRKGPRVLYLGDSLAMENQNVLGKQLRDGLGARYTSAPRSGTTLCDYLEGTGEDSLVPTEHKAATLVAEKRPDYVVLQFWGNSWGYTPCMGGLTHEASPAAYFQRYAADAGRLSGQISAAARRAGMTPPRIVWVLQGPDPITPDRVREVNAVYAERARDTGELLADAGAAVSAPGARHTWTQYLPCTERERTTAGACTDRARDRTALHRDDDYLHFCLAPTTPRSRPCPVPSPGITRIARAITATVAEHRR
ncbi:SGNH/GDSL hydrolase family protein [Streptomyces uncialis]|uniref:SGNH/GDSL hydrolase family protein n=1 Tax=Streptomyces uncialis TaxID=1048205 RepID=UPI0038666A11|nr:SGNH/GDSL hydrolase family protein [Streptomyces uncialis]